MQTQKEIKNRINSTKSINKITKAMFLMSSVKSQKALKEYKKFKDYINLLQDSILRMETSLELEDKLEGNYYVVLTSDLGLAGSFNTDIIKKLSKVYKPGDRLLLVGNKSKSFAKNMNLSTKDYDVISLDVLKKDGFGEIIEKIKDSYNNDNFKVSIIYSKYISQLETSATVLPVLPVSKMETQEETIDKDNDYYDFEPNVESLYPKAIMTYLDIFINWLLKEVDLSEQVSRKQAMDNATKNSQDMIDDLNVVLNKTRQAKITQEISEIIGGAEALK